MTSIPDRRRILKLVEEAQSQGARRAKVCDLLGIHTRTLSRWQDDTGQVRPDGRPEADRSAPANKLSEEERQRILEVCNLPQYAHLPPSQIVPALADEGVYIASESTFYRVLREANQLHHRGKAQAPKKVPKPTSHCATAPNQVWSWDITFLATTVTGLFLKLYLIMDIYSRKIVGWEIHESECAAYASVLIQKACLAEGIDPAGLVLHADNGGPMKAATMLATLQKLGVVPSFSRPSVSDDNPYSEALFRSLKYAPAFPLKPFEGLEDARQWVHAFVQWYNEEHLHSALKFISPGQRHRGEDKAILEARQAVYEQAKQRHPERWSSGIRNWKPVAEVWLNPNNDNIPIPGVRDLAA